MTDRDSFEDRRRALEEEYFRKRDAELIEKMRRHSALASVRQQIIETTGVEDEALIADLQARGYTAEMVRVLPLVPLLQVAWADGLVSDKERGLILAMARARGIEEGSEASGKLMEWLERRPEEEVFEAGLRLVSVILAAMPPDRRAESQRDLVAYCTSIASASGGLFGFGSISSEESAVLERLAAELERAHPEGVKRLLEPE